MSVKPTVTFVTAFLDLREDRSKDKSPDTCFKHFRVLAESGVYLCLFVSADYYEAAKRLSDEYKNVRVLQPIEIEDLWTYAVAKAQSDVALPNQRTSHHDTFNFFCLMNGKIEFVKKAMLVNPFQTSHFAWIDFSICHVIRSQNTLKRLATYGQSTLKPSMLAFPGCYNKERADQFVGRVCDGVLWRFCGGFFIGDAGSLDSFYETYLTQFPRFLQEKRTLVWEVNFWLWLENQGLIQPEVYMGDHNDSMLMIPSDYLYVVASLTTIPPRYERCKATLRSLLNQVDHIYVSASSFYERFGVASLPEFSNEKVTIVESKDFGPATKYLGALSRIPDSCWIFFCDDDQEYKADCVKKMKDSIVELGGYQNRYHIVKNGSGGIVHGYVGNLFHKGLLGDLPSFMLPSCARFVDDQWLSIYCFKKGVKLFPTALKEYSEIFSVLRNGYEQIGEQSLASFGNRSEKVDELAKHFGVKFLAGGDLEAL